MLLVHVYLHIDRGRPWHDWDEKSRSTKDRTENEKLLREEINTEKTMRVRSTKK